MQDALLTRLEQLNSRQLARFLDYLHQRRRLDGTLESDIKRAFRFYHEDLVTAINEKTDKENTDERND